jgi:hypothetical protein
MLKDGFCGTVYLGVRDCVTICHPGQAPQSGASRDLEFSGIILYLWIPDLALHSIARPE